MDSNPESSFTEEQARAIFEEAARRQAALRTFDGPTLSLAELQKIASQAGLEPDLVSAAAAHISTPPPPAGKQRRFWDVPDEVRVERVLPADVSDELWERMVAELRRTFGEAGRAGQFGRVREWATEGAKPESGSTKPAPVRVEVTPEAGQTRVTLSQSLANYRTTAYVVGGALPIAALIAAGLGTAIGGIPNVLPLVFIVGFSLLGAMVFMLTHLTADRLNRRQNATFEALLDRLDLLAMRRIQVDFAATASPRTSQPAPLADLLDADRPASGEKSRGTRQRGRS